MTARSSSTLSGGTAFGLLASNITGSALSRKTRVRLERGDNPRSGQPVWRNSYTEGTIEHQIWSPINGGKVRDGKRWTGALLKAARAFEIRTRAKRREVEPGARNGDLGDIGLEVLRYLYEVVDFMTGRRSFCSYPFPPRYIARPPREIRTRRRGGAPRDDR